MTDQCPQTPTDAELVAFVRDANTMHRMEADLEAGISKLLARPFDAAAQDQVRALLDSDQMRQATDIAQGLVHRGRGEA